MSAVDLTLVREFKHRAEQALPGRIVRVMLYGSRARGDARPDSDWDVAIFVNGEPTSRDRSVLSEIGVTPRAANRLEKAEEFLAQLTILAPG
jgi:predicted nucleotidyltransferase